MAKPPTATFSRSIVFAGCLWLAGCAGSGLFNTGVDAPPFSDPTMTLQTASEVVVIGKSGKTDVMAALGGARVVRFDSGYEVWVYRAASRQPPEAKAEFVILFTPDGVVKKTRIRPAALQVGR